MSKTKLFSMGSARQLLPGILYTTMVYVHGSLMSCPSVVYARAGATAPLSHYTDRERSQSRVPIRLLMPMLLLWLARYEGHRRSDVLTFVQDPCGNNRRPYRRCPKTPQIPTVRGIAIAVRQLVLIEAVG